MPLLISLFWFLAYSSEVNFEESEIDSQVAQLEHCGADNKSVLILTTNQSLYRSENYGFSFIHLTGVLNSLGQAQIQESNVRLGKLQEIMINPVDKNIVFFRGSGGVYWLSQDCGRNIQAFNFGRKFDEISFHPTEKNWALAATWTQCSDFENEPCRIFKQLYLTKDLGQTWTQIADYIGQFSWAQAQLDKLIRKQLPKERIYAARTKNQTGDQKMQGWILDMDLVKTDDYFKSQTVLVERGNKFMQSQQYILVAQALEDEQSQVQLLSSYGANIEKFRNINLPIQKLDQHSYTIVDASENTIIININHFGYTAKYGNLYISDDTGRNFSLSLLHNIREADGQCDIERVYGLQGIYIANVFDRVELNQSSIKQNTKTKQAKQSMKTKHSLITFNKGGSWQKLNPPEKNYKGQDYDCPSGNCSLNLHSLTSKKFTQFYSVQSAPGIVIGTGNVGEMLLSSQSDVGVFLSRDGGFTWYHVKQGSFIYEIGDHGALIVMAENQMDTDTLYYTWNEGLSWETLKFTDFPIQVENIVIQPEATSQNFIVFGSRGEQGVVIGVDFSSLHEPQCKNPENPGQKNSDYEIWTPHDGRFSSRCILGQYSEYVRRKREAECYNGEEFERQTFLEKCECTREDYECDYGFFKSENGSCVTQEVPEIVKCEEGDLYYEVPTGYRKIPGNVCQGGVNLQPQKIACNSSLLNEYAVIILGFLVAVSGALLYSRHSELIKEKLNGLIGQYGFFHNRQGYSTDFNRVPESAIEESGHLAQQEESIYGDDFDPRN